MIKVPGWFSGLAADGTPFQVTSSFALYRSRIGDYMDRLILLTPWGTLRLHRILRADDAREHLHDHPFDFTSCILLGGYRERCEDGRVVEHPAGSIIRRKATDAHAIVSVKPWTTTLVVSGPRIRSWGFQTPHGWIRHTDYAAYLREHP